MLLYIIIYYMLTFFFASSGRAVVWRWWTSCLRGPTLPRQRRPWPWERKWASTPGSCLRLWRTRQGPPGNAPRTPPVNFLISSPVSGFFNYYTLKFVKPWFYLSTNRLLHGSFIYFVIDDEVKYFCRYLSTALSCPRHGRNPAAHTLTKSLICFEEADEQISACYQTSLRWHELPGWLCGREEGAEKTGFERA